MDYDVYLENGERVGSIELLVGRGVPLWQVGDVVPIAYQDEMRHFGVVGLDPVDSSLIRATVRLLPKGDTD